MSCRPSPTPARRRALIALAAAMAAGLAPASAAGAAPGDTDRIAVGFAVSADADERRSARAAVDGRIADTLASRVQILEVPDGTAAEAVAELRAEPGIAWAEAGVRRTAAAAAPNDPGFAAQWALANTGQGGGVVGADIDALPAWDVSRGDGVLVGVVDSGVAPGRLDTGTLHTNAREIAGNLLDDDRNGFLDDVRGWDFVSDDADPADDNGHGTAVGSVVNAATNNARSMAGVAPGARVLHAKALAADGSGSSLDVADAMDYLADQGAPIVNLSLGGGRSRAEAAVIDAHPRTLFVVAAGNDNVNNDGTTKVSYPCAEPAANVLCVGASNRFDAKSSFSNWGRTTVDVMAPGTAVHVLLHDLDDTALWNGTSFSSPVVAGIAALLKAARPAASVADLKQAILTSVDPIAAFATITVTGGRVNAARALQALSGATLTAPVTPEPSPATTPPATEPPVTTAPVTPPAAPADPGVPADPGAPAAPVLDPPVLAPPPPRVDAPRRPVVRIDPRLRFDARGRALVRLTFGVVDRRSPVTVRLVSSSGLAGVSSLRPQTGRTQTVRVTLARAGRVALRSRRSVVVTIEVRVAGRIVRTTLRAAARRR